MDDELTARLATQTQAFSFLRSSQSSEDGSGSGSISTYERIYPACADYQEPSRLIRKLPEFAECAEHLSKEGAGGRRSTLWSSKAAEATDPAARASLPESRTSSRAGVGSDGAPHYAEADIISLQESSDSGSITAVNMNLFAGSDLTLREFPKEKLTFKEKLGEGQFGEVNSFFDLALKLLLFSVK